jgi:iron complex transport system permease protein
MLPMKLLVDVAKLEADGTITPQQAVQIRRVAAADTGTLAINVIATIGAFAVISGLLALKPTSVQVAVIGLGLTAAGALIRKFRQTQLGFLGSSLIVIGAVLLAAGLVLKCSGIAPRASSFLFTCPATPKWYGHMVIFLVVTAWLLAVGALAQNGLLVVLSAFALAGALGSSTGYWHASYGLMVRESTVTIVVFGLLGALASYLSMRVLQEPYARLARLFALIALLWVNFGFWVGSLWGDYPLEAWIAPDVLSPPYSPEAWNALQAWKARAFFISRDVFSVVWALALAGVGFWGATQNRRGAVNMAATFGGIHFYTQWFERLNASPQMVMAAGVIAVAVAFALWRYNQRQAATVAV